MPIHVYQSPFAELLGWDLEVYCDCSIVQAENHVANMRLGRSVPKNRAAAILTCPLNVNCDSIGKDSPVFYGAVYVTGRHTKSGALLTFDDLISILTFIKDISGYHFNASVMADKNNETVVQEIVTEVQRYEAWGLYS